MEMGGVAYETEAPSVFSQDGSGSGYRQTEWLYANGHFQY